MTTRPSTAALGTTPRASSEKPTLTTYMLVTVCLALWGVLLRVAIDRAGSEPAAADALLGPIYAQTALTGSVWLSMVLVRNYAILRELVPSTYYRDYQESIPNDWVERPARVFNNLMQVPTLFYVVCLLLIQLGRTDAAQVALAWLFVSSRVVHTVVYIGWNHVPTRFAVWLMGGIALITLWLRFAMH
ncbi:MAG: hypothetical protein JWN04_6010 [Myxococcaceae bacterium]|nr:hypothetical protein [Myxococcaceae bacterium]